MAWLGSLSLYGPRDQAKDKGGGGFLGGQGQRGDGWWPCGGARPPRDFGAERVAPRTTLDGVQARHTGNVGDRGHVTSRRAHLSWEICGPGRTARHAEGRAEVAVKAVKAAEGPRRGLGGPGDVMHGALGWGTQ